LGRYTKPNIDLQKEFLKNLKRCGWSGGVSDVTPLSVKSQVFRTDFAYSQLFSRTNIYATAWNEREHLPNHFVVWFGTVRGKIKCEGPSEYLLKMLKKMLNVSFRELEVPERAETSESWVIRQALFAERTMSVVSERARGLQSTHTIYLFDPNQFLPLRGTFKYRKQLTEDIYYGCLSARVVY
jgi:hypothetical protein